MSFSLEVKKEISENKSITKVKRTAFVYGMLLNCHLFTVNEITLRTANSVTVKTFTDEIYRLLKIKKCNGISTKKVGSVYFVTVSQLLSKKIFSYFETTKYQINEDVDSISPFLAGSFMVCGNITNPKKSYQIEFIMNTINSEIEFEKIIFKTGIKLGKSIKRNKTVFYSKDRRDVQDLLAFIGATKSMFEVVDAELFKEIKNRTNRLNNFDTANISKTASAALIQIENIEILDKFYGINHLPDSISDTANLRLKNPYASIRELQYLFPYKISVAGIHGRFAKIAKMADEIKNRTYSEMENNNV